MVGISCNPNLKHHKKSTAEKFVPQFPTKSRGMSIYA